MRRPSSLRAQGSAYSPIRGAGSDAAAQVAYSGGSGGNSSGGGGSMTDGGSVGERRPHTHGPRVRLRALRAPHRLPPSPSLPFSPLLPAFRKRHIRQDRAAQRLAAFTPETVLLLERYSYAETGERQRVK